MATEFNSNTGLDRSQLPPMPYVDDEEVWSEEEEFGEGSAIATHTCQVGRSLQTLGQTLVLGPYAGSGVVIPKLAFGVADDAGRATAVTESLAVWV